MIHQIVDMKMNSEGVFEEVKEVPVQFQQKAEEQTSSTTHTQHGIRNLEDLMGQVLNTKVNGSNNAGHRVVNSILDNDVHIYESIYAGINFDESEYKLYGRGNAK
jgi:hypothetical protein